MQAVDRWDPSRRRRMSPREDAITMGLASWLVLGIFLDGWAHNTGTLVETFFTPWHAALYSGFAASASWICLSVWRRRAPQRSWREAIPPGYAPAVAGVVIFLASGAGYATWHLLFGIERSIGALLSPTHLGLFTGGLLIITAPLRAAWDDPERSQDSPFSDLLPAIGSAALAGCLTIFILQEFAQLRQNAFVSVNAALGIGFIRPISDLTSNLNVEAGVAAFMIGSLTLFVPLLLLARRFRVTASMAAIVMGVQIVLLQALQGFNDPGLVALGLVGTAAVCVAATMLRPGPARRTALLAFAGIGPPLFWGIFLLGVAMHDHGLGWKPELWGGGLVWSALSVLAVASALTAAPVLHHQPAAGALAREGRA
ncbi:MAG: hypothetical protein ACRDOD_14735 [Streptosporangiaceae bacterium]